MKIEYYNHSPRCLARFANFCLSRGMVRTSDTVFIRISKLEGPEFLRRNELGSICSFDVLFVPTFPLPEFEELATFCSCPL